jgi:hypothetical protein
MSSYYGRHNRVADSCNSWASQVTLGTKPNTRTLNPKYPDSDPKYPNPHYPMSSSNSKQC